MGNKIGNAPDGERSTINGSEKLPLGSTDNVSSWWAYISSIAEYLRTLTQTLTNKTLTTPTIADFTNANHDHSDSDDGGTVAESSITFTNITTNNSSITKHGYLPKLDSDSDATKFLSGVGTWLSPGGNVYDSDIIFQDITTGNADSDSHGFLLKLSMDTAKFLRSDGTWQAPPAGGSVYDSDVIFSDNITNNADSDMHGYLPKLSGDSDTYLDGDGEWRTVTGGSGALVQKVGTVTGASSSGTTLIPYDDTIPGSSEGDEYMTQAITPTNAAHDLYISVTVFGSVDATDYMCVALFKNSDSDALAADAVYIDSGTASDTLHFVYKMTAGTTSAITFKVRAGRSSGGTFRFNGRTSTGRIFGGVAASSIIIEEIVP
jgi:hypothetical protein